MKMLFRAIKRKTVLSLLPLVFAIQGKPQLLAQNTRPGSLDHVEPPVYPLAAKAAGIEGAVTVHCVVGKDGKVRDVRAIRGPSELQQAAVDVVSRWTYHPYTHFGRTVEVDTTVTVNFVMGKGKDKLEQQEKAKNALAKQTEESSEPESAPAASPK
jgi:TonB family protein